MVEAALTHARSSGRFSRAPALYLAPEAEGIHELRDRLMRAITRARQLDWLCQCVSSTAELQRASLESKRALPKLRKPWLFSRPPAWEVTLRSGQDDVAHSTTILDIDEGWAVVGSGIRLGASVSLEHHSVTTRALLCIRGDVIFADDQVALIIFDGPAIVTP